MTVVCQMFTQPIAETPLHKISNYCYIATVESCISYFEVYCLLRPSSFVDACVEKLRYSANWQFIVFVTSSVCIPTEGKPHLYRRSNNLGIRGISKSEESTKFLKSCGMYKVKSIQVGGRI